MEQECQIKSAAINRPEVEKARSIAPLDENDFFILYALQTSLLTVLSVQNEPKQKAV